VDSGADSGFEGLGFELGLGFEPLGFEPLYFELGLGLELELDLLGLADPADEWTETEQAGSTRQAPSAKAKMDALRCMVSS
jgi:hypothetical protein